GTAFRIQRQRGDSLPVHCLTQLPFYQGFGQQHQEIHTQQRLDASDVLEEYRRHGEVCFQLGKTLFDVRLAFVGLQNHQCRQLSVVGYQREDAIGLAFARDALGIQRIVKCLSEKYLFLKLLSVRSERLCAGGRSFSTTAIVSAAFFPNKPADRRSFHAEPFVGFFLSTARRFHRRITPLFCACSWLPDSSRLPARSAVSPTHEGYGPRFPSPRSAHSQSCSGHDSALARCPIVTRRSPTPLRGDDDATPETRHCLPPVARGLAPNPSPPSTDA